MDPLSWAVCVQTGTGSEQAEGAYRHIPARSVGSEIQPDKAESEGGGGPLSGRRMKHGRALEATRRDVSIFSHLVAYLRQETPGIRRSSLKELRNSGSPWLAAVVPVFVDNP
jgi:hypothetical protein